MINEISIDDFKKNELKTLELVSNFGFLEKALPDLSQEISQTYYYYKSKDFSKTDFSFTWIFSCPVEQKSKKIVLGGQVIGNFDIASYYLGICGEKDAESNLIRKFHFDYANPKIVTQQPVPLFHLQYGGDLYEGVRERNITDKGLETWLSLPRLNFSPINLALLLDIFLCEFRNEEINKIVENPHWCGIVRDNEKLLTKHYYLAISEFITTGKHGKKKLIRDLLYEK